MESWHLTKLAISVTFHINMHYSTDICYILQFLFGLNFDGLPCLGMDKNSHSPLGTSWVPTNKKVFTEALLVIMFGLRHYRALIGSQLCQSFSLDQSVIILSSFLYI